MLLSTLKAMQCCITADGIVQGKTNTSRAKYMSYVDVLLCSIAVYFYKLCRYFNELKGESKYKKYKAILHTKTSNKRFIIQQL